MYELFLILLGMALAFCLEQLWLTWRAWKTRPYVSVQVSRYSAEDVWPDPAVLDEVERRRPSFFDQETG